MKRITACLLVLCLLFGLTPFIRADVTAGSKRSYIIVLGNDALKSSVGLKSFVDYKSTNFDVSVISVADIVKQFPTVTDTVERLRQYLDTKTQPTSPYVLLIGTVDEIPMTMFKTEYEGVYYSQSSATDCVLEYNKPLSFFDTNHNGITGEASDLESVSNNLSPVFIVGRILSHDIVILDNYFLLLINAEKHYESNPLLAGTAVGAVTVLPLSNQDGCLNDEVGKQIQESFPEVIWTDLFEHSGSLASSSGQALTMQSFIKSWNGSDVVYVSAHGGRWRLIWNDNNHNGIADEGESGMEEFCPNIPDPQMFNTVYLAWYNGCVTVDVLNSYNNVFDLNLFNDGKLLNFVGYTGLANGLTLQAFQFFSFIRKGYSIGDSLKQMKTVGLRATNNSQELLYNIYELTLVGDPSARLNNKVSATVSISSVTPIRPGMPISLSWNRSDPIWAYNVQVSSLSDFTNLVKSDMTYTNNYQIPSLPVGNYFWRVQGVYDNGLGDWSETKSFAVYEPLNLVVNSLPTQVSDQEVIVSGNTNGSRILINNQEQVVINERFSTVITLSLGKNTVKVTAFDDYGQSVTKELVITYQTLKPEMVLELKIGVPTIWINGKASVLDVAPSIINSRTLVPLRAIFEAVGGDVGWDPATRLITILSRGQNLVLTIGKNTAILNGKVVSIDLNPKVVPTITNSRTLLPLRFVAEAFGFQVDWNAGARSIVLTYSGGS